MAYSMVYWEADGPKPESYVAIKEHRLLRFDRKARTLTLERDGKEYTWDGIIALRPAGTALITVSRTDRQSPHEIEIWRDPNDTRGL